MPTRSPGHDSREPLAPTAPAGAGVRIDLWLWAARFHRTRSLAKQAVETGKVEVDGARPKPSRMLRGGEALRIERAGELYEVAVLALSDVRGPASAAQRLYAETDASKARRAELRAQRAAERNGYQPPEGRPDKRARRLIRALGDIDAT
jgi:ribosome-associated heat shock protein Hsp15